MPTISDDVCLNKASIIERALRRILEEFAADHSLTEYTHIDAMTLNIERACQATIDVALHVVARDHLGIPQNSADAFRLLHKSQLLSEPITRSMIAMTGFRNIAIHEYQHMDMSVLRAIGESRWRDFIAFCKELGLVVRIE